MIADVLSRFVAAIDPVLRFVLAGICRLHDPGAKLFAFLDDWYMWIKPQCLLKAFALMTTATTFGMEKTTQRFQRIATTLAELNAEELSM